MPRRRRPPRAGALSELPPLKIAAQIATLQVLYYLAALVLFIFSALVSGLPFGADTIFGWDLVRGDTTQGWVMSFVWLLDGGLCMPIALVLLIARSKLVLDFALTIHFLHLVATSVYTRTIPRTMMWWLTMLASSAVCVAVGMWGCRYRELQPVFFGGGRILGNNATPAAATVAGAHDDDDDDDDIPGHVDEEMGLTASKGRGRQRSQDEYEMDKLGSKR